MIWREPGGVVAEGSIKAIARRDHHDDRDVKCRQILLIRELAIDCEKDIELSDSKGQQLTVLRAGPAHFPGYARLLRLFERRDRLLPADSRKVVAEVGQRLAALSIVEQGFQEYARSHVLSMRPSLIARLCV